MSKNDILALSVHTKVRSRVSASEGRLLTLARGLMEGASAIELGLGMGGSGTPRRSDRRNGPSHRASIKAPRRMGPSADRILRTTLARGSVRVLVRSGGWRRERRPDGSGRVVEGRLWERHPPRTLAFSDASRRLLVWLLYGAGKKRKAFRLIGSGDGLLGLLIGELLVERGATVELQALRAHPLIQLALPWWVEGSPVDWVAFIRDYAWLLEAMGDRVAACWVVAERAKANSRRPHDVLAGSARQQVVLEGFLDAVVAANRRDLADFLLTLGERLFPDPADPPDLGAQSMDMRAPLRERVEARRAASGVFDALIRLRRGIASDRGVRFIDDEYDAAQARLARWERFGDARYLAVVRQREALHALA